MEHFRKLLELLPVIAQLIPGGQVVSMVAQIVGVAEQEITRRMQQTSKTREEVIADATAEWDEDLKKVVELALLGHEGEQGSSSDN